MCIRDSLHSSSSCPVSAALCLEVGSGSPLGGFGATPALTRPPLVQSVRPCGSSSAPDHGTEASERHPPSLVLLLSSQRDLVARARLWITVRRLCSDIRLHSSSSCPVSAALWLELGSGSQYGGFGATPAFTRAPLVQSAWPCGLNTARFAVVPGSKRSPCERWQGVIVALWFEHSSVRSRSGLKAQPNASPLAGGLARWCLRLNWESK